MSDRHTTTLRLFLIRETDHARLYRLSPVDGGKTPKTMWFPKSVCPKTTKFSDEEHQVEVEDWFLEKNEL